MVTGSYECHGRRRDKEGAIALADDMEMGHRKNEHDAAIRIGQSDDPRGPLLGPEFQGGLAVDNSDRLAHESGLGEEQKDDDDDGISHAIPPKNEMWRRERNVRGLPVCEQN